MPDPLPGTTVWCVFDSLGHLSSVHATEDAAQDHVARMSEFVSSDRIEPWHVHAEAIPEFGS